MNEKPLLNRLEHSLLSSTANGDDPLHVLYHDAVRDIAGANLYTVLEAMIKLLDLGFLECRISYFGDWRECVKITFADLERQFESHSAKLLPVPKSIKHMTNEYVEELANEYYFKITEKGKLEEAKDIYESYYPESDSE